MVIAVAVALRRHVFLVSSFRGTRGVRGRILLPVAFKNLLLHRFRESTDRVARRLFEWRAAEADRVAGDLHCAFRAREDQSLALLASVHEVDAETKVKAFPIVKESQHHVGSVASIFPEAQSAGCHGSRGAICARDEVGSAEQVHEEVPSHAASIGFPFTPLEKVFCVKGNPGRRSQKSWPIAGFGRGIQRNRIVPGAHCRIAIPMRGYHVELTDSS